MRGYYADEQRDILDLLKNHQDKIPKELHSYRQIITHSRPEPSVFSLGSATLNKALTLPERLWLDLIYQAGANPRGDLNILKATFISHSRRQGVR